MCAASAIDIMRHASGGSAAHANMDAPTSDFSEVFSAYRLDQSPAIVAAVSGGSDSVALLLLLKDWLRAKSSTSRLVAVTIDHQLRPESTSEAAKVAQLAKRFGIGHRTLSWDGPKPRTGLVAAARGARYRLLGQAATEVGASVILTAHTADDQAETVFMRAKRGDGLGLAGMAPATLVDETHWLLRPLLRTRRETLREYLSQRDIGWVDDPTNTNPDYERARVRTELANAPGKFDQLITLSRERAGERLSIALRAAELVSHHARQPSPGLFHLVPDFLRTDDRKAAAHAFRYLLAAVGGTEHPPHIDRIDRLLEHAASGPSRRTISRSVVAARRDGIWLCREARGLPSPAMFAEDVTWDGRFRLVNASVPTGALISVLGADAARMIEVDEQLPQSLARTALAGRPVIDAGTIGCPVHGAATPTIAPFRHFLPAFDLPLAQALAKLAGAAAYPAPPWPGHIVTQA